MTFNQRDNVGSSAPNSALMAGVGRVIVVEHDQAYRELLTGELSERGFVVQGFGDPHSVLDSLDAVGGSDVIVLDGGGPSMHGIKLLTALRRRGVTLPVVVLIGEAELAHECLALDHGAIDVICRSRGFDVVTRRLKRIVEASRTDANPVAEDSVVCGRLRLQPKLSRAYWNDVDVDLTLGEYNIVHLLASRVGRYVTYRAVYDRLHYEGFIAGGGPHGYRANVRSAIKRIRNKFRAVDPHFERIENYTSFGYRWRTSN